jgi:hypothetical protein
MIALDRPAAERPFIQLAVAAGLLLPFFFQLGHGIYHSPEIILYDSGGSIMDVPLPASLLVVLLGAVLLGDYRRAGAAVGFLLIMLGGMALTTVVAAVSGGLEMRKLLLLVQFLVPAGALVTARLYGSRDDALVRCAVGFVAVLVAIVPLQMVISLRRHLIWHDLGLFTIYQHRQYVPIVFVGAYVLSAFLLIENRRARPWVLVLAPVIGAYAAASYAVLALALLGGGLSILVLARIRSAAPWLCLGLAVAGAATFLYYDRGSTSFAAKYGTFRSAQPEAALERNAGAAPAGDEPSRAQSPAPQGAISTTNSGAGTGPSNRTAPAGERADTQSRVPLNVRPRLSDWALYARGILESPVTALFGHAKPFDRAVSTSAHNYYLDLMYNFGVIGLLPLFSLIGYTAVLLWRQRQTLQRDLPLLGLATVAGFLVVLDNNFKVTFRQPYPGLFGFFLWGLLLSRLTTNRRGPVT